jgi:integrase
VLSDADVDLLSIADLVGHNNTQTTQIVYRQQIRPTLAKGAEVMDAIFHE